MHTIHVSFDIPVATTSPSHTERLTDEDHLDLVMAQPGIGKKFLQLHTRILAARHHDLILLNDPADTLSVQLLDMVQLHFYNPFQEPLTAISRAALLWRVERMAPVSNTTLFEYLMGHGVIRIGSLSAPAQSKPARVLVRDGTLFLVRPDGDIPLQISRESVFVPSDVWHAAHGMHVFNKMIVQR
jgi:hypothetical protein